ncbi:MAG TPA: redoxin domain-containing protein [Chthonomonadaceae bacterium]|nr:redoxin domain-containing protein [Chthonomonadaceae bacterium]
MYLTLLKRAVVCVGIGMLVWSVGSGADTSGKKAAAMAAHGAFHWKDVNGHSYDQALLARHKATVFFFVSSQCPIANLYTPRILAIARDYTPRGVQFFLVDSNSEDSLATVRRYAKERAFPFPAIKDEGTALADTLAADKTPEAIILDSAGAVRYRGRIDDNAGPEKSIHHDTREALDALLAGRSVPHPRTLSFGCIIFRDKPAPRAASPASVTYARDIAPILNANCVMCHRQGETAPFSLETYQEARTWAAQIKDYTARRLMPPWKAVPGYGDFRDAHFLTAKQIASLARWADAGAPLGNPKDLPAPPPFPSPNGWKLGTPDLVLSPSRPYHLAADGKDVYREYVLPVSYDEARYLRGVEFKPDNRAVVHHIILFFDPSGESAKLDGHDSQPGYTVPGDWISPPGSTWGGQVIWVAGWAPGNTPSLLPEGTAFEIPAHASLVLQVHYHKDGKPEEDRSQVALYFAEKGKVDKVMHVGAAINATFDLKPGLAHQEVRASFTLPKGVDVHVWAAFPHMHMLGRQMKLWATLPNGTVKPLIWIQDWDFNWQESYRYKTPLALPGGTRVELLAIYDNSERNPRQPSHPPKEVRWGEQTTDEMCIGFFQFTVDKQHLAQK